MIALLLFVPLGVLLADRPALIAPVAVLVTQSVTTTWALLDLAALAFAGLLMEGREP